MIEIPEPPDQPACASCGPLIWMLSARTRRWVAWLQLDDSTVRLHPCRTAQDPATWRTMPRRPAQEQQQINAAGRELAEKALRGEPSEPTAADVPPPGSDPTRRGAAALTTSDARPVTTVHLPTTA